MQAGSLRDDCYLNTSRNALKIMGVEDSGKIPGFLSMSLQQNFWVFAEFGDLDR